MRVVLHDYDRLMRRILMVFGAALVAGLVAAVALVSGERLVAGPAEPSDPEEESMTTFRDEDTGFALSYPEGWQRIHVTDPDVRLVVTPSRGDSVLVRVVTLDDAVSAEDLPAVRSFTDELITGGEPVQVLADPTAVEIGGLPGIQYVYTFTDAGSGEEGVHYHYFLFDGDTMYAVVFQALPTEDFAELAPTFEAVINSFEVQSS